MLSDDQKSQIQALLSNLSKSLPQYRSRLSQRRMIAAVAHALSRAQPCPDADAEGVPANEGESIIAVEGPTGTGKSLAYLIAAAFMAREAGRKLIVSSATVSLQEQLVHRDIPFFVEHAGFSTRYVLAKGRSRYVCALRLFKTAGYASHDLRQTEMFEATWERKPDQNEITYLRQLSDDYAHQRWSGDRDELPEPPPNDLWARITTDRHGCLNRKCAHFDQCAQMRARTAIREADIVVTNHDLLLADIALGGGVILPAPEQSFYVIDEAHHLPDKALSAFAAEHGVERAISLIERSEQVMDRLTIALPTEAAAPLIHTVKSQGVALAQSLNDLEKLLASKEELLPTQTIRQPMLRFTMDSEFGQALSVLGLTIRQLSNSVMQALEALEELLDSLRDAPGDANEGLLPLIAETGSLTGRIAAIAHTWNLILTVETPADAPIARWVMAEINRNGRDTEYWVCASPVSAADGLSALWTRSGGAVLTSATLRSLGTFDKLLTDTGLDRLPHTETLALDSPFSYPEQGTLVVPKMRSNPKNPAEHTREIIEMMPDLIDLNTPAGTLVLFSSRRQMEEVAQGLPGPLRSVTQLQGERSKVEILEQHRSRIQAGAPAVLFGLDSFAEGLDLPGDACNHVIIAKLPFAVPDHPVSTTLSEWIAAKGGNPFMQMSVPAACLKLIQAVGRLIRTEQDIGRVTILDTRIATTAYGRQMLASLPAFRRVIMGRESVAAPSPAPPA